MEYSNWYKINRHSKGFLDSVPFKKGKIRAIVEGIELINGNKSMHISLSNYEIDLLLEKLALLKELRVQLKEIGKYNPEWDNIDNQMNNEQSPKTERRP